MRWAERLVSLLETSTFRYASLIAFIFLLVVAGSVLFSRSQIERLLHDHVHEMILEDIQDHEHKQLLRNAERLAHALADGEMRERTDSLALVLNAQGEVLFGARELADALSCRPPCALGWRTVVMAGNDGYPMQIIGMQLPLSDGGVLFRAYDVLPMLERVRIIPLVAGAGLFAVLLSSLGIGLCSSLRSMRRVDRIRSALSRYASGDREVQVPSREGGGDEFDLLGMDINHVLGRVNILMEEVKSVSGHLAHELRTPLTRLHSRLAGVAERLDDDMRGDVMAAVGEAERIQRMFKAVLRIGEIEAGRCAHVFEWFDSRALLCDVKDYYQPLVEAAGMRLSLEESAEELELYGDRALLFQALSNLLENAVKYAPDGDGIVLMARRRGSEFELGVADDGPGIPEAKRGEAVERFRRMGGNAQGSGLGLALVNAVAKLHAVPLVLADNVPRGLVATLCFKRSQWRHRPPADPGRAIDEA
ncbi:sensor histidine kinase [Pseudothauera nasutitermitis]|nr:HAMP domain-containing sensor histidine kinase [Pseudothauera nasutitermitis]